ncbi:UNVERIFIED_CONTAM: Long chain acyl-CoA synthetase 4 [Sesamum radiatum]|uniref:Long chain acyl-CoA synthetase 4 n=1 Tax=Sesamum radiatum TaxID=300843 RepID=A0AAW2MEP9_SESRA
MAYRRGVTARAKFFYQQQQRAVPSFSHVCRDDSDREEFNSNPIPRNTEIRNYFQHRFFGTGNSFGAFSGSRNLFKDMRFGIPAGCGPVFSRNFSSGTVGEGAADKIEILNDVDVLGDKAVEVAGQVAPVVSEVAVVAADSFFPVAALQYLIDYVHTYTGFNWWASIVVTTLLIRSIQLPLLINQLKSTSKFTLLRPKLEAIKEEMQNREMSPNAVAEGQAQMKKLFKEYGVTPFTPLKGLLISGPIFCSFFFAVNNLAEKVPSFKEGGALWFTDLTTPDSMYIFPVLTALTFWITVELLKTFPGATKCLRTIVSFGKVTSQQRDEVQKFGVTIYSWDEFLSLGENEDFDLPVKKKTDICTIMYTSGTTGDPKGVMISNNSIVTLIAGVKRLLESVNESDVKLLVEDIGELKPTIFCAVPRVLDRIYSGLQQKISSGGFIKHTMFNLAYSLKLRSMRKGHKHAEASPLCDKIVFSKVKQGLGGKVRLILSGAAPLASHVEEFLRVVSGSYVLQGYDVSRCFHEMRSQINRLVLHVPDRNLCGTFVSIPDELSMLGTVGPPVPNVDVCLESVPEMGYDALSSTPRGEVCVRGDTLFSGYYKRDDLTKEVFVDGWFHTGDIGEWQENGSLKIIDRKKNIFKLSQGEYVAVENLENIYGLVPAIESIWVYGNSFESFLVAIINPNKQVLEQWAEENGVSGDFNALCENPKLKGFEFIKAVHLDPVPFDMERDLITPTFKKKRPQLLKYYQGAVFDLSNK